MDFLAYPLRDRAGDQLGVGKALRTFREFGRELRRALQLVGKGLMGFEPAVPPIVCEYRPADFGGFFAREPALVLQLQPQHGVGGMIVIAPPNDSLAETQEIRIQTRNGYSSNFKIPGGADR